MIAIAKGRRNFPGNHYDLQGKRTSKPNYRVPWVQGDRSYLWRGTLDAPAALLECITLESRSRDGQSEGEGERIGRIERIESGTEMEERQQMMARAYSDGFDFLRIF